MENKQFWLKKDGDSGEFDYIDQDGVSHNSPEGWLWSFLGGCGCGSSEDFAKEAWKVLQIFAAPHMERMDDCVYTNDIDELLAHWMDSVGMLEHGTSVSSSWLSEKGKQIYDCIKELQGGSAPHTN